MASEIPCRDMMAELSALCNIGTSPESTACILESVFCEIATALESLFDKARARLPRTYFILWQLNRQNALDAFLAKGLNDTSIPFKKCGDLPNTLDVSEAAQFLKWQTCVASDTLHLETGVHLTVSKGNDLFEKTRPELGIGSQGTTIVDKVTSKLTGKVYARKRINRKAQFGHDRAAQKIFENELHSLKKVKDHNHLIKIKGTYTDKKYFAMLLQPVADGNLKDFLHGARNLDPDYQIHLRSYFGCLISTIAFLHEQKMIHKDIKPENILLKDCRLILTDFGTAFDWSQTGQSMTMRNTSDIRTPRYQSPEVAKSSEFHRASDIWSSGVVLLEIITILHGHSLEDLDEFLSGQGTQAKMAHANIEAVHAWLQHLEKGSASPVDKVPIRWIAQMLRAQRTERPSASQLSLAFAQSAGGQFTGSCCADVESDSDTSSSSCGPIISPFESSNLKSGIRPVPLNGIQHEYESSHPQSRKAKIASSQQLDEGLAIYAPPGAFPMSQDSSVHEEPQVEVSTSRSKDFRASRQHPTNFKQPVKNAVVRLSSQPLSARNIKAVETDTRRSSGPNFLWQRMTSSIRQSYVPKSARSAQLIEYFLSSLPEEGAVYKNPLAEDDDQPTTQSFPLSGSTSRPRCWKSESNLPFCPQDSEIAAEDQYWPEPPGKRLVHFASDENLIPGRVVPDFTRREALDDLRENWPFQAVPSISDEPTADARAAARSWAEVEDPQAPTVATNQVKVVPPPPVPTSAPPAVPPLSGPKPTPSALVENLRKARGANSQPATTSHTSYSVGTGILLPKSRRAVAPSIAQSNHSRPLSSYLDTGNKRKPKPASAAVVIEQIMERNRKHTAPTTVLSARVRAIGQAPLLCWNDFTYGYLQHYASQGKAGAVRELLARGCNPGTVKKPRWAPIFFSVRGASDRHNKCLSALLAGGANVNARSSSSKKTLLQYAIETKVWDGYTHTIYILLSNKADSNLSDSAGNLPLSMLLLGASPLSPERRDAVLLLLAPEYGTDVNVSEAQTKDTSLHLAIRHKDPAIVEAILEKVDQDASRTLIRTKNRRGLTPIGLVTECFTFHGASRDDELEILELLLSYGADANDSTSGTTLLLWILQRVQNLSALQILHSHNVNTNLSDASGLVPDRLIRQKRSSSSSAEKHWWAHAEQVLAGSKGARPRPSLS